MALGYHAKDKLKVDLEAVIQKMKSENILGSVSISVGYFISNMYYHTNIGDTKFAPYITVGAGVTGVGNKGIIPVLQGKLGINYQLTEKFQLSFGYHLMGIISRNDSHVNANNVEAGLIFHF